jgi:hypothetical protein
MGRLTGMRRTCFLKHVIEGMIEEKMRKKTRATTG